MPTAYVALGANMGDPPRQVVDAMATLAGLPDTAVTARSRLYWTPPWGVTDQPAFINAALCLDTQLDPRALLTALQGIENRAGRVRVQRWGPRTLDLDLLLYGDQLRSEPDLTLPHPRIAQRAFVLLPLADINPQLLVPGQGRVADLLAKVDTTGCRVLDEVSATTVSG